MSNSRMYTSILVALLASTAAAKNATFVNGAPQYAVATQLTVVGSSSGTTTYVQNCATGGIAPGISNVASCTKEWNSLISSELATETDFSSDAFSTEFPTATGVASTVDLTAITAAPTVTGGARFRRAQSSEDSCLEVVDRTGTGDICEPFTIIQGPSTAEVHLTDPSDGMMTIDVTCAWSGSFTSADFTCTETTKGWYFDQLAAEFSTTNSGSIATETVAATDASDYSVIQNLAVVTGSAASSGAKATGSAASGSAAAKSGSQSSGFAPGAPLPTGAVAWGAGAAGIFAAALAL